MAENSKPILVELEGSNMRYSLTSNENDRFKDLADNDRTRNLISVLLNKRVKFPKHFTKEHTVDIFRILNYFNNISSETSNLLNNIEISSDFKYEIPQGNTFIQTKKTKDGYNFTKTSGPNNWNTHIRIPLPENSSRFCITVKVNNTNNDKSGLFLGIGGSSHNSKSYWSLASLARTGTSRKTKVELSPNNNIGHAEGGYIYTFDVDKNRDTVKIFYSIPNKNIENQLYDEREDKKLSSFSKPLNFSILIYYKLTSVTIQGYRKGGLENSIDEKDVESSYLLRSINKHNLFDYYMFFYELKMKEYMLELCLFINSFFEMQNRHDITSLLFQFVKSFQIFEMKKHKFNINSDLNIKMDINISQVSDEDLEFSSIFTLTLYYILHDHTRWSTLRNVLLNKIPQLCFFIQKRDSSENMKKALTISELNDVLKNHKDVYGVTNIHTFSKYINSSRRLLNPGMSCNFIIISNDGKKIKVHLEMLIYRSNYFYVALKHLIHVKDEKFMKYNVKCLNALQLGFLLTWIYSGKLEEERVDELLLLLTFSTRYEEFKLSTCIIGKILGKFKSWKDFENQIKTYFPKIRTSIDENFHQYFVDFWNSEIGEQNTERFLFQSQRDAQRKTLGRRTYFFGGRNTKEDVKFDDKEMELYEESQQVLLKEVLEMKGKFDTIKKTMYLEIERLEKQVKDLKNQIIIEEAKKSKSK